MNGILGSFKGLPFLTWRIAKESVIYTAGGRGAVGTDTLFTVTGDILVDFIVGIVNTNLTEGAATSTLKVGVAGNAAKLIPVTGSVDLDDGDVWLDSSPGVGIEGVPTSQIKYIVNDGADFIQTVGSQTITAGQIDFYCLWAPLEAGASVLPAT